MTEIHAGVALLTRISELRLQGDQASRLAAGLREISRHYEIPRIMSPGRQAIAAFGLTYVNVMRENFAAPAQSATAPAQPAGPPPGVTLGDNVAAFPATPGGWGNA